MGGETTLGWRQMKFAEMLSYEQPGPYLVTTTQHLDAGRVPVLTAGKTFILGYTNDDHGVYTKHPVIIFDDFTTASKFVDFDFKAKSSAMKILSGRPGIANVRYLYERMQMISFPVGDHKRHWISEYSQTAIGVPGIMEQNRVADVISDLTRQVSGLLSLIAKKQALRQGVMQQLLTGRTRLSDFNESWRQVRLGSHVTYLKTVALSRAQLDNDSPVRYLHYGDIHKSDELTLAAGKTPMPRASLARVGDAGRLQLGDLVFADASEDQDGVGKSIEITSVPSEGVVPGLHTIAARFDKSVLADGFKAYLQFVPSFRVSLLRLVAGTKVLATTRSQISSIELALPSVLEQVAITAALHDSDEEIRALRLRLAKARSVKQGVMQEVLTGRTRLRIEASTA